jgi:hypothetical protein
VRKGYEIITKCLDAGRLFWLLQTLTLGDEKFSITTVVDIGGYPDYEELP